MSALYPHLPEGRDPGPQSRGRYGTRFFRAIFGRGAARSKKFSLDVTPVEVPRGGSLRAELTVKDPSELGSLEVGLVCKVIHDHLDPAPKAYKQTLETDLDAGWHRASASEPVQTFDLSVPADAPFSYEGQSLSYAWRVTARAPLELRRDERDDRPIWVLP